MVGLEVGAMRNVFRAVHFVFLTAAVTLGQAPDEQTAFPLFPHSTATEYRVGTDDLLEITVFEIADLNSTTRVSAAGYISMPLLGPIEATGLTSQELATKIEDSLRRNYVNDPHVTVFIREYASQPVSVVGAVEAPDIYQIKGRKTLMEMLALAGGLREDAGGTIQVIRSRPPVAGEAFSAARPDTISISVEDLFERGQTALNVPILSGDVINVLQAGTVFVLGEVNRPDQYVLRNGRNVTVTQALALGGGFAPDAKRSETTIVRLHLDETREEIPVDADKLLKGEIPDVAMLPNDILFVPSSKAKPALRRALDAAIGVVSGMIIYRGYR
jgi:polysaccharide export outer membrane protein